MNNHFAKLATGSTRFGLSLESIHKLPLFLPALEEQKRIAEILSAVDEQIESIRIGIQKYQKIEAGLTKTLVDEPTLPFSDFVLIRPPFTNKPGNEEDAAFLPMECLSENGEITSFHHRKWSDIKQGFTRSIGWQRRG